MTTTTVGGFEEGPAAQGPKAGHGTPAAGPARPGGLTLPVLVLAAVVASPAIYQCLVSHTVPVQVMLERYVLIALGCLVVSEGVRRLLWPSTSTSGPTVVANPAADGRAADETLVMPPVVPGAVAAGGSPAAAVDPALTAAGAQD
jgi:hypothetical protein